MSFCLSNSIILSLLILPNIIFCYNFYHNNDYKNNEQKQLNKYCDCLNDLFSFNSDYHIEYSYIDVNGKINIMLTIYDQNGQLFINNINCHLLCKIYNILVNGAVCSISNKSLLL